MNNQRKIQYNRTLKEVNGKEKVGYKRKPATSYKQPKRRKATGQTGKRKIKKIVLPPTTIKGVETYLRNKGYRINPALQGEKRGAKLTFDKPLPKGRLHGDVHASKNGIKINQHVDKCDPYRDPIGHLVEDWTRDIPNSTSMIPKKNPKKRRRRGKKDRRSYI